MMCAAELFDQPHPHPAVGLELFQLERIDDVAQITGDHCILRIVLLGPSAARYSNRQSPTWFTPSKRWSFRAAKAVALTLSRSVSGQFTVSSLWALSAFQLLFTLQSRMQATRTKFPGLQGRIENALKKFSRLRQPLAKMLLGEPKAQGQRLSISLSCDSSRWISLLGAQQQYDRFEERAVR